MVKMAMNTRGSSIKVVLIVGLIFLVAQAEAGGPPVFDVTTFGAKGNGEPEYSEEGESMIGLAFVQAWQKACNSIGPSKVVIPKGKFAVAQVLFTGPCQSRVTVELQGDIIPDPDVSQFPNKELLVFQQVEGATFTGRGIIDNTLEKMPPGDPEQEYVLMDVMPSISLLNVTNFVLDGIHSTNPVAFHVFIDRSHNVSIVNANFDTAKVTPNTRSNGIVITSSSLVAITNSQIKTGDDCITIAGGSTDVSVTGVTCVDGQGISVGAQPMTNPESDVKGVRVTRCTFKGTSFGARINPRPQEKPSQVSGVFFEDLVMENAQNPISIIQEFPPKPNKAQHAKITDVHFKNIRGTTGTNAAVSFNCNKASPCDGIEVADVSLTFTGKPGKGAPGLSAHCVNAKVIFGGKHDGLDCK